jgi:hypothetical protein
MIAYLHLIKPLIMKIKYTPGTPDGLVGKTHTVEIITIDLHKVPFIDQPVLKQVQIKYEDGEVEWIDGMKLISSINNTSSTVNVWIR